MGGRGASSGKASPAQQMSKGINVTPPQQATPQAAPQQPQTPQPNIQQPTPAQASNWVPPGVLNYTLSQLPGLNDADALKVLSAADGVDMPNHLKDAPDGTQELIYALGLNAPPQVMDKTAFDNFRKQNNIPQSQVMARGVSSGRYNTTSGNQRRLSDAQIAQMWISDPYNYIGGKHGGQALGAGAYFDMNGGGSTGYAPGGTLYEGVLNPKTARVISDSRLRTESAKWARTHPKADAKLQRLARKTNGWGSPEKSLYALMLGYNVIAGGGGYHNVIVRDAMVIKQ